MTDVTDVIVARQRRRDSLGPMVGWSVVAHLSIVAVLVFGPFDLRLRSEEPPRTVMTISLAGAPGPRSGMTPMAGRAVPEPPPEPAPPRPAPPPPKPPENTVSTRPQPPQRTRPRPTPEEPPQAGETRTDTGARGRGFGLATGGGGGSGVQLDVADFCCPEYLQQMIALIQQNWASRQGMTGVTGMKFTILRSGLIQDVMVEQTSGFTGLDLAAQQALLRTRLPELPVPFPNPTLTVHMKFVYER